MIDDDHLVQRFVDQELSAEERMRFVGRLGRDESLRRRAIELERLVLGASRLPRPAVPDAFVARVMERSAPPASAASAPSIWRRMAYPLFAPRDFHWNLAGAFACLAVLLVGGVVAGRLTSSPSPSVSAPDSAQGTIAAAAAPVLIRLVIVRPGAHTVQVAGDFNGWNPVRTPLEQVSEGAWAVTIPLQPGRYEYMFVVDGAQWIPDPFATEQSDDGFGSRNAVLDVRPLETKTGAQS